LFQEIISELTDSVVSGIKNTISQYHPKNAMAEGGAFERISQQGIQNIYYRSPILGDLAYSAAKSFQRVVNKKQSIDAHVKSVDSEKLRDTIKEEMGTDATPSEIEKRMSEVLRKMDTAFDKDGHQEAKKSDIFSKYGQHFENFKEKTDTNFVKSESTSPSPSPVSSTNSFESGDNKESSSLSSENSKALHNIEINTQRIYNAVEALVSKTNMSGSTSTGSNGTSFIDPLTGMPSIRAAIGHVGGTFLGKIFDPETIDNASEKVKNHVYNFFGKRKAESNPEFESVVPDTAKTASTVKNAFDDLKNNLNTSADSKEVFPSDSEIEPVVKNKDIPESEPVKVSRSPGISIDHITDIIKDLSLDLGDKPTPKKVGGNLPAIKNVLKDLSFSKIPLISKRDKEFKPEILSSDSNKLEELTKVSKDILTQVKKISKNTENKAGMFADKNSKSLDPKEIIKEKILSKIKEKISKHSDSIEEVIRNSRKSASYTQKEGSTFGLLKNVGTAAEVEGGVGLGAAIGGGALALKVGSMLGTAAPVVGALAAPAAVGGAGAALALGAATLGVGAAGAAGSLVGNKVLNPLIDKGLSSLTGNKDTTLGNYIYDMFNSDKDKEALSSPEIAKKMSPLPPKTTDMIAAMSAEKIKSESAESNASTPPIIITGNGNSSNSTSDSSSGSSTTTTQIRNTESSFERVQMQDFWPRTA
jgi:hypothetical protein